ncbi:MAG TPA: hypothetical protein VFX61_10490 [Micromonosporaceae bacterium]|nr:hypothetical protein [Micromonosporaceae bacterium]
MAAASRPSRATLVAWAAGPIFELPVVALTASSSAAPFGSSGTQVALYGALLVTLVGVVVAWGPSALPATARHSITLLLAVAAGITGTLGLVAVANAQAGHSILLAHSTVSICAIGLLAHRWTRRVQPMGKGGEAAAIDVAVKALIKVIEVDPDRARVLLRERIEQAGEPTNDVQRRAREEVEDLLNDLENSAEARERVARYLVGAPAVPSAPAKHELDL